jgi:4-hydroxy-tetrahydrodipicolinate synthase
MTSQALIGDYFRAVADAAGVPVFIQNLGGRVGSSLTGVFMAQLCRDIPLVQYVKEERDPHGPNVDEVIAMGEPAVRGVFTGGQVLGLVDSHRRGAAGNIASAELADVYAQIWDRMEAGDEAGARRIQEAEAVAYKVMRSYHDMRTRKVVLVQRGVLSGYACRNRGDAPLDDVTLSELEHAVRALEPHFRV